MCKIPWKICLNSNVLKYTASPSPAKVRIFFFLINNLLPFVPSKVGIHLSRDVLKRLRAHFLTASVSQGSEPYTVLCKSQHSDGINAR